MANEKKPIPEVRGEEAIYFQEAQQERLVYQHCPQCSAIIWYLRTVCPTCLNDLLEVRASQGTGQVYSYTVVTRAGAPGYDDEVPYTVALVELDEGFRVMANVLHCSPEQVHVGQRVRVVFEERANGYKVPQFVPEEVQAR